MATKRRLLRDRNTAFLISMILFAVSVGGMIVALNANSRGAKSRYDNLIAVDAAGGDVEAALAELREFIYGHMNTTIGSPTGVYPPIQLKGTYDRLVAAEEARIKSANSQLYDEATVHCESLFPAGNLPGRAECVSSYVAERGVVGNSVPDGLYKFNFASPTWSPDLAGWLIVATVVLGINFLLQILLEFRLRSHMRQIS